MEKLSVMNLVDLAGSEKVGKTGATGDRLKEGTYNYR
jgi:kinesin family member 13